MTRLSLTCSFDPSTFNLSESTRKATKIDFNIQPEQRISLVNQGTWSVLPFARVLPFTDTFGKEIVGIRLLPGKVLAQSPVVVCSQNQIVTVSTSLSTALPMLIYRYKLYKLRRGKESLRELWPEVKDELIELHVAMGGEDHLEGLESVIFDDKLYPQSDNAAVVQEAACESLERLDSNPQHLLYRKYLHQAITKQVVAIPLPDRLGTWRNAAAVVALQISNQLKKNIEEQQLAAWEVAKLPASIDTSTSRTIEHIFKLGGNADLRVAKAAQILVKQQDSVLQEWKRDPIWTATITLANEGKTYNGLAHVEAAKNLDESGEPARAFDALISAAFWSYNFQGEALISVVDAARYLATQHEWEEISEILENLANLYNK
ncbi:MAG: hypothetical protein RMY64_08040 [Nostoc sp. DedQUE08]|uniref:hypothetical protein n=1 Tax=unclassified Nostoc TaxID=2593658 RepID=UPI002AD2B974|nr:MULTISPECIES: hypothetical protein [unclassified Nostoc]MDZ8065577.1 hypothetical protein [Nostoc sp. DedQUE08]MDZ8091405.1 hypothetical protein [Nostoc sp. DedQUE05]